MLGIRNYQPAKNPPSKQNNQPSFGVIVIKDGKFLGKSKESVIGIVKEVCKSLEVEGKKPKDILFRLMYDNHFIKSEHHRFPSVGIEVIIPSVEGMQKEVFWIKAKELSDTQGIPCVSSNSNPFNHLAPEIATDLNEVISVSEDDALKAILAPSKKPVERVKSSLEKAVDGIISFIKTVNSPQNKTTFAKLEEANIINASFWRDSIPINEAKKSPLIFINHERP